VTINYTYCKLYSNESYHFNTRFKLAQNDLEKAKVIWIYTAAETGEPIEEMYYYSIYILCQNFIF